MQTCVLFGDSHLANFSKRRLTALEVAAPPLEVWNCAAGGWDSFDLAAKAPRVAKLQPDIAVLSVGANDAAPWKRIEPDAFERQLGVAIRAFQGSRVLVLLVPPVAEWLQPPRQERSNVELAEYRERGVAACEATGAEPVDVWPAFEPALGIYELDGTHLNDDGYALLIEQLAAAIRGD